MKHKIILPLLLFFTTSLFAQDMLNESPFPATPPAGRLEVTYIANSGFMFAAGNTRVLVDALYLDGDIWETPTKKLQKAMTRGAAPFKNINYFLVSHYHEDHFNATLMSRYLVNNPKTTLITNMQTDSVMKRILKQDPELKRPDQMKIIDIPMFSSESFEADQFKVKCLAQRHMGKEDYKVQSLGFLIEMGGKKIIHIGDAGWEEENFAGFKLQDEDIDIAFIHYWFLLDCEGRRIIENYIKPEKIVITHIPYEELRRNYKRIKEYYPDVEVFLNHMDKKIY